MSFWLPIICMTLLCRSPAKHDHQRVVIDSLAHCSAIRFLIECYALFCNLNRFSTVGVKWWTCFTEGYLGSRDYKKQSNEKTSRTRQEWSGCKRAASSATRCRFQVWFFKASFRLFSQLSRTKIRHQEWRVYILGLLNVQLDLANINACMTHEYNLHCTQLPCCIWVICMSGPKALIVTQKRHSKMISIVSHAVPACSQPTRCIIQTVDVILKKLIDAFYVSKLRSGFMSVKLSICRQNLGSYWLRTGSNKDMVIASWSKCHSVETLKGHCTNFDLFLVLKVYSGRDLPDLSHCKCEAFTMVSKLDNSCKVSDLI